jgi:hypothetical protein
MQLNQRDQGNRAVVGDTRRGDRRPFHMFAFAIVPVDQRSEQMPQLRARVQIVRPGQKAQFTRTAKVQWRLQRRRPEGISLSPGLDSGSGGLLGHTGPTH